MQPNTITTYKKDAVFIWFILGVAIIFSCSSIAGVLFILNPTSIFVQFEGVIIIGGGLIGFFYCKIKELIN
jgi:hypothetical protein